MPEPLSEIRRRVLELYAAGKTPGEVAALVHATERNVQEVLHTLGVRDRTTADARLRADDEARRALAKPADPVGDVLTRGEAHELQRIRTLAARARTLVETLRDMLAAHEKEVAARARIAQLEKELAAARAQLPAPTKPAGRKKALTGGVNDAEVRAWARTTGRDVNAKGRVPAELVDAYLAEQGGRQ